MYEFGAKLIRVVDGDTVDANVDLGFNVWVKQRIRLYGIDAPETRTRDLKEKQAGFETKKRLSELLEKNDGSFVLKSHGIGKYGRCLGTLFIDNIDLNKLLLNEGLAGEY